MENHTKLFDFWRIKFDKVNGFIRDYDGTKYLLLFILKCDTIYDRIRYLIIKSGIRYVFFSGTVV